LAVISIKKAYPGQAKRAAMAFWSALPQFTYTKFVVVVDQAINVRDPRQVVWAIAAQVDPQRDLFVLQDTPFDSLDFASERLGLGGQVGTKGSVIRLAGAELLLHLLLGRVSTPCFYLSELKIDLKPFAAAPG
jgi:hypothetical protein